VKPVRLMPGMQRMNNDCIFVCPLVSTKNALQSHTFSAISGQSDAVSKATEGVAEAESMTTPLKDAVDDFATERRACTKDSRISQLFAKFLAHLLALLTRSGGSS